MKNKHLSVGLSLLLLSSLMTGCNGFDTTALKTKSTEPQQSVSAESSALTTVEAVTEATTVDTPSTTTPYTTSAEPIETTKPETTTTTTSAATLQTNEYGFPDDDLSDLFGDSTSSTTKPSTTNPASTTKPGFPDDDLSDLFGDSTSSTTKPSTTKPASTTKPTNNDPPEAKEVPVLSFETTDFVQYTYANNNLKLSSRYPTLYDFASSKSVGIGGDNKTIRFAEMNYGVSAEINRNTLTYKVYNNSSNTVSAKSTVLEDDNTSTAITTAAVKNTDYDISKLSNGLYRLRTKFSTNKTLDLYFLINGNKAYLCSAEGLTSSQIKSYKERREKIYQLIKAEGITANDCLDTSQLCYPYYPYNEKYRCDTQRWIDLSNKICKNTWTAEHKLYAIHEWMTANLAYDYYKSDVLGMTRARYFSDWSGTHATYTNHVGVCADFSDILITMCRAQGIPTTTISTRNHVWNVVYLDGIWTEIDMTRDINRAVYGKDTSKVSNATDIYDYTGYFIPVCNKNKPSEMLYANASIRTIDFVLGKDDNHGKVV